MGEIADLFATLGCKVDGGSWARADEALRKAMGGLQDLDRQADKLAASSKASQAANRAAAAKERAAAREAAAVERAAAREIAARDRAAAAAQRAVRGLEREETRQVFARARGAQRIEQLQRRTHAQQELLVKQRKHEREAIEADVMGGVGSVATAGVAVAALAAYFGGSVVKSGIEFNATMEDSKDEVAGMLALTNKTHLADELKNADMLVDNLRERAAKLPGTTQEYIQMLSMITQPIMDAKLGLKGLEDLTVQSVVAAKGLHVPWEVAARDIDQAIRGQFHSTDPFSSKVLGSIGYKGEEGRSRFNALTQEKRAQELQRALMQSQFTELGEAAGKSFRGRLSTLQDAWEYFKGAITKPLFEKLAVQLERVNTWLDKNQDKVKEVAEAIASALGTAFDYIVAAIEWIADHDIWTGMKAQFGAMFGWVIALGYGVYRFVEGIRSLADEFSHLGDIAARVLPLLNPFVAAANYFRGHGPEASVAAAVDAAHGEPAVPADTGTARPVRSSEDESAGSLSPFPPPTPPPSITSGRQPLAMTVDVGGITVTSNSTDPAAVAQEVTRAFDERLAYHLRRTIDEVA